MTQRFVVESDDLGLWGIWDTSQHTFTSQGTPVRAWARIMADALNERGQVQPECASCGATDLNPACAAGAGWRLVLGRLRCRPCAGVFPAWMRRSF